MCVKINVAVCAMYSVHIALYSAPRIYFIYARCAIRLFIYPRRTNAFCAH